MSARVAPALLLLLLAAICAPMLVRPGYLLYPQDGDVTDLTITHWPAMAYNARSLHEDGQVPLWRTTIASGGPWVANPLSGLTYPPAWLSTVLPVNVALNLLLFGHLALAAAATFAFGRQALRLEPTGAVVAGLAFAAAPWITGQLAAGHLNITMALAWLPIALLGIDHALRRGRAGGALLAGIAWAAALVNYVQIGAFVAAISAAWFVFLIGAREATGSRRRQFGLFITVAATALLLSAALLVPMAEALPYLNRTELTPAEAGILSLPWPQLLTMVVPAYGGEPEQLVYLGLPVLVLAIAGLALKRDRAAWFFVAVAALAALFALGTHTPLFPLLLRLVPGLGWLRVPPRIWVLVAFAVALLAGRGLDALARTQLGSAHRRRVTLVALVVAAAGVTLGAGLALLYWPPPPAAWTLAALTLLTALLLTLRSRAALSPHFFTVAIVILIAADAGAVRAAWTEMRAPADAFAWRAEAAAYLAQQPGRFRAYSPDYSLPQHVAMQHSLYLADGVDPIQLEHYVDFLARAGGYPLGGYSPTLPPVMGLQTAEPDAGRMGLLNAGYVVAGYPIEADGLVLQERLGDTYIYHNERVLPRAFVVPDPPAAAGGSISLGDIDGPQPAEITVYAPNRIVVEANLDAPGLLVLGEVWYPGWRALDGAGPSGDELPIHRVEDTLRGVYLAAGAHRVEFRYRPWTVWAGVATSGATTLLLLGYAARAVFLARRQAGAKP
jgi:hypothetical protein